jgi:hypothetical protein
LLVIVQIFVAQGQRRDPLRNHFRHRVLNAGRIAPIQKAPRQARQQIQSAIGFAQQQTSRVRGHRAAVELAGHLP